MPPLIKQEWRVTRLRRLPSFIFHATFHVVDGKLKVLNLREATRPYGQKKIEKLAYTSEIIGYQPKKNLAKFWGLALKNYNK